MVFAPAKEMSRPFQGEVLHDLALFRTLQVVPLRRHTSPRRRWKCRGSRCPRWSAAGLGSSPRCGWGCWWWWHLFPSLFLLLLSPGIDYFYLPCHRCCRCTHLCTYPTGLCTYAVPTRQIMKQYTVGPSRSFERAGEQGLCHEREKSMRWKYVDNPVHHDPFITPFKSRACYRTTPHAL